MSRVNSMSEVNLDLRKLLGFKIIADGRSTVQLTSPKIGDKAVISIAQTGPLSAKVGFKGG